MRIFLFLLALHTLVFASYEQVSEFYKNAQYDQAIEEAKASTSEYANPKLHLLWAKSALSLGYLNEAIAAYERVIILDEHNTDAKIELLKLYTQTSKDELAKTLYDELLNTALTSEEKNIVQSIYKKSLSSVDFRGSLALGYDTNINVSPKNSVIDDYLGSTGDSAEQSSLFSRLNANVTYTNELEDEGGWYLKSDLNLYAQNNFDAHFYDLYIGSLGVGAGYSTGNYNLYIPLGYTRLYYLQKDFLEEISLKPKVSMMLFEKLILNLNASYKKRNYVHSEDSYRDDSSLGGGMGFVYLFSKNYIYFNTAYESYKADTSATLSFLDKDIITLDLIFHFRLTSALKTKLSYRYRDAQYSDYAITSATTLSSSKREDTYNKAGISFLYELSKNYEIYLSNEYIKNDSNSVLAQYSKNITLLGIDLKY